MAAKKYMTMSGGKQQLESAQDSSAGAGDAGKIVALGADGKLASNMMPPGIAADSAASLTASENLSAGNLVNIWNDGGTLKVRKADASSAAKSADGFVTAAYDADDTDVEVIFDGTIAGLSGLTLGAEYVLSDATPGGTLAIASAPSDAGDIIQYVGKAKSTTELIFERGEPVVIAA